MKLLALCAVVGVVSLPLASHVSAQNVQNSESDPEKLIDNLTALDCPVPGASGTGTFLGFLPDEEPEKPVATLLLNQSGKAQVPPTCQGKPILDILSHGLMALPALLRHVDDNRPTKLVIGDPNGGPVMFGAEYFSEEYSPRHLTLPLIQCEGDPYCLKMRPCNKAYTVKVGDLCFLIIGQIVNRPLSAVRYQPSGIVKVNSPVESPALAQRVRADWLGVGPEGVKETLLADLEATDHEGKPIALVQSGALHRLRYYFPDAYASLTGADLVKRKTFEEAERGPSGH